LGGKRTGKSEEVNQTGANTVGELRLSGPVNGLLSGSLHSCTYWQTGRVADWQSSTTVNL